MDTVLLVLDALRSGFAYFIMLLTFCGGIFVLVALLCGFYQLLCLFKPGGFKKFIKSF